MNDQPAERNPSFFSRLDFFHKIVGLGAALIAVWGTYVTIQTNRNSDKLSEVEARLSSLKEERVWAKELYTSYDAIVSKEANEQARIDRLAGLLALTELTDEKWPTLRAQWATLIKQQAARYKAALAAQTGTAPRTQQVEAQLSQYNQLQEAAAAAAIRAGAVWSNYDFDIFYCPGEANREAAQKIVLLKSDDPKATGTWRLRALSSPNSNFVRDKRPYSIVWDFEDEVPFARSLEKQLREKGIAGTGATFRMLQAKARTTRWYLSVYVCPSASGGPVS